MLYRNGDHTYPANFRPIGLNNTMEKLWTAMVTTAIACYTENMGIMSSTQEGFRAHISTHRHILNLIHDIEDTALHNQARYICRKDATQLHKKILMVGAYATCTPPTKRCTYLGMHICLNLDWKSQLQHTLAMTRGKGNYIANIAMGSGASTRQSIHLIQTSVLTHDGVHPNHSNYSNQSPQ